MNFAEAVDYLYRLRNQGSKYGIDRMESLVRHLGHPERHYPVIHVAGTNGKGSVCAMVESIFRTAGYRTGLFTSPHLVHLGERIQVDRQPLPEERIAAYTRELSQVAASIAESDPDLHPTFFEFLTAMAFLEFARAGVDIAIVETGLGGRLDSTNVVQPDATAITSIGYDHMEQLGSTLAAIAGEKAGIIKSGVPIVIGRLPEEAREVIATAAARREAPLHEVDTLYPDSRSLPDTALSGEIQRWNAAVATTLIRLVRERLPVADEAIQAGLKTVRWPGRWEKTSHCGRELIFDATHNAESAVVLEEQLRKLAKKNVRAHVVVGILGAERAAAILPCITPYTDLLYLVTPAQPRALSTDELAGFIPASFTGEIIHASVDTLFGSRSPLFQSPHAPPLLVTGSIYLLGEVKTCLGETAGLLKGLQDRP